MEGSLLVPPDKASIIGKSLWKVSRSIPVAKQHIHPRSVLFDPVVVIDWMLDSVCEPRPGSGSTSTAYAVDSPSIGIVILVLSTQLLS